MLGKLHRSHRLRGFPRAVLQLRTCVDFRHSATDQRPRPIHHCFLSCRHRPINNRNSCRPLPRWQQWYRPCPHSHRLWQQPNHHHRYWKPSTFPLRTRQRCFHSHHWWQAHCFGCRHWRFRHVLDQPTLEGSHLTSARFDNAVVPSLSHLYLHEHALET